MSVLFVVVVVVVVVAVVVVVVVVVVVAVLVVPGIGGISPTVLREILQRTFGHDDFRGRQEWVVRRCLRGESTLVRNFYSTLCLVRCALCAHGACTGACLGGGGIVALCTSVIRLLPLPPAVSVVVG